MILFILFLILLALDGNFGFVKWHPRLRHNRNKERIVWLKNALAVCESYLAWKAHRKHIGKALRASHPLDLIYCNLYTY